MEHFSEECVPAVAAEVDIGTKRKRRSVTSKSKCPRKSKQDKENQAPGSLTLGSGKASTSGAAEADTISTTKRRVLRKAEKKEVADAVLKVEKADLVASVLQQVDNELHILFSSQIRTLGDV